MKFNRLLIALPLLMLCAGFWEGCSTVKPDSTVEYISSDRLVNKLEANRRKIRNFEGSGSISVKTPSFDNSASFRIVIEKPDSIYLTIYGPFSIELAQILVTKTNFIFYEALKNTAYTGPVNDDLIRNIFKIDLSFNDVIDAFTGGVNMSSRLYKEPTSFDVVTDKYLLSYVDTTKNEVARYTADVRDLNIVEYKAEDLQGKEKLLSSYSDFKIFETVSLPKKIEMKRVKEGQYITIEYDKISVNKSTTTIDFSLPDDADVVKW